jgi:hypothetical protein
MENIAFSDELIDEIVVHMQEKKVRVVNDNHIDPYDLFDLRHYRVSYKEWLEKQPEEEQEHNITTEDEKDEDDDDEEDEGGYNTDYEQPIRGRSFSAWLNDFPKEQQHIRPQPSKDQALFWEVFYNYAEKAMCPN